jgi:hypothetical protein
MAGTIDLLDPDELPTMAAALSRHLGTVHHVRDRSTAAVHVIRGRVDRAVGELRQRVVEAEAALRAASEEDEPAALARLADAKHRHQRGEQLRRLLNRQLDELAQSVRAQARAVEVAAGPGIDRLGRFWTGLTGATASFRAQLSRFTPARPGSGAQLTGPGTSAATGPAPAMSAVLNRPTVGPHGHVLVGLDQIDTSDSTVRGPESFQHVPMGEMREGLLLLERVLAAIENGADRDELRRLDATYLRVYDAFFGDTAIRLVRRPDGRYEVTNGYHRIWLARQLGIDELPARVVEP